MWHGLVLDVLFFSFCVTLIDHFGIRALPTPSLRRSPQVGGGHPNVQRGGGADATRRRRSLRDRNPNPWGLGSNSFGKPGLEGPIGL